MFKSHHVIAASTLALAAAGVMALQACAQSAARPAEGAPTFEAIDSNKDGTISKAEFQAFAAHTPPLVQGAPGPGGHREMHMHHMAPMDIKSLDTNGDGKISFEEFAAPMKAHFGEMDANHDGFLQAGELPPPPPPLQDGGMPPAPPPGN